MSKFVSYIRVSTAQQRKSGLGIEAQREALARFAEAEGFEIAAEFVEVETGKGNDAGGKGTCSDFAADKGRAQCSQGPRSEARQSEYLSGP
jgi:hypothetical protein